MARLHLREMTQEERLELEKFSRSQKAEARLVRRAEMILRCYQGESANQVGLYLHVDQETVLYWVHRFEKQSLAGLEDEKRSGRPATYTQEEVSQIIATALTDPQALSLPFSSWTLDRLQSYLQQERGIAMKRSRIDEILRAEGLRWRHQERWFGERVDPDFAKKRGSSPPSTKLPGSTAPSSV